METEFCVWVLDDNPANLGMIERSFPEAVRAAIEVRSFVDAGDFLAAFDALSGPTRDASPISSCWITSWGGCTAVRCWTTCCRPIGRAGPSGGDHRAFQHGPGQRVPLAGRCGFRTPEAEGWGTSPPIAEVFGTVDALRWMKRHRRPLPPDYAADAPAPPA